MINIDSFSLNKNDSYNYNLPQNFQSIETKTTNFFSPYTNIIQIPCKISIDEHEIKNAYPQINYQNINKKTLILDIDETLVHSSMTPFPNGSHLTIEMKVSGRKYIAYVLKRPYLEHFLQEMSSLYEVIVFTASIAEYAEPLLQELDRNKIIKYKLNRSHCIFIQGNYIKDLRVIKRPMKDLIIIDNNPISYAINPDNGIPILSWFDNPNDTELLKLIPLLKYLAKVNDVRPIIKQVVNKNLNQLDFNIIDKIINNKSQNFTYLNKQVINNNLNENIQKNLVSTFKSNNNNVNLVKYVNILPNKNDYNNINQINNNIIYTKQETTDNNIKNNQKINSILNSNKMNDNNINISNNGNINSNNQIIKSVNNSIYNNINNKYYNIIYNNNIKNTDININKSVANINIINNDHNIINEPKSNIINNNISKKSNDIKYQKNAKIIDDKNNFNKKNDNNINTINSLDKNNNIKIDKNNKENRNYMKVNQENKNFNLTKEQPISNNILINKNNNNININRYVLNQNYNINSVFNDKPKHNKIVTKKISPSNSSDNLNNSKIELKYLKNNFSSTNIINTSHNLKNKNAIVQKTEIFDSFMNNTSFKYNKEYENKNILNEEDKKTQLEFNKINFKKAKVIKLNADLVFNKLLSNNLDEKLDNKYENKNPFLLTSLNSKVKDLQSKNYSNINNYIPNQNFDIQIDDKITNQGNIEKNIKKVIKLKINDKTKNVNNNNSENDDTNNFVKIKRIEVKKIKSSKSPKNKEIKVRKIIDKENEKVNKINNISKSPFDRKKYLKNCFEILDN